LDHWGSLPRGGCVIMKFIRVGVLPGFIGTGEKNRIFSEKIKVPISTNEGNQLQAAGIVNASSHNGNNLGNSCTYAVSLLYFPTKNAFPGLKVWVEMWVALPTKLATYISEFSTTMRYVKAGKLRRLKAFTRLAKIKWYNQAIWIETGK